MPGSVLRVVDGPIQRSRNPVSVCARRHGAPQMVAQRDQGPLKRPVGSRAMGRLGGPVARRCLGCFNPQRRTPDTHRQWLLPKRCCDTLKRTELLYRVQTGNPALGETLLCKASFPRQKGNTTALQRKACPREHRDGLGSQNNLRQPLIIKQPVWYVFRAEYRLQSQPCAGPCAQRYRSSRSGRQEFGATITRAGWRKGNEWVVGGGGGGLQVATPCRPAARQCFDVFPAIPSHVHSNPPTSEQVQQASFPSARRAARRMLVPATRPSGMSEGLGSVHRSSRHTLDWTAASSSSSSSRPTAEESRSSSDNTYTHTRKRSTPLPYRHPASTNGRRPRLRPAGWPMHRMGLVSHKITARGWLVGWVRSVVRGLSRGNWRGRSSVRDPFHSL